MEALGPMVSPFMNSVVTITIFSGALLYLHFFVGGVDRTWRTGAEIGFTIGALGATMSSAGTPPKQEQVMEMNRLQMRLVNIFRVDLVTPVLAMLAMTTVRYL